VSEIFEVVPLSGCDVDHCVIIRKLLDSIFSSTMETKVAVHQILLNA
jgi:hypothetical protein